MKKIIPFSKEIEFNTNIYEINSISLEHNLKIKDKWLRWKKLEVKRDCWYSL